MTFLFLFFPGLVCLTNHCTLSESLLFLCSGALLTIGGDGARKGHTKSASISAAASQYSDIPPLDTNIDAALRARLVRARLAPPHAAAPLFLSLTSCTYLVYIKVALKIIESS